MPDSTDNVETRDIGALIRDDALIDGAIEQGVREALREHKLFGNPIAVVRDGRLVLIPPEEIDMPPEQVSGKLAAMGPGCDIYSLGVVLYELLTARPPFTGDLLALLSQIALDDPKPPSKHREEIDPQLDDICLKAMAKQPVDRHLSMGDFANALSDYLLSGGEDRLLAELVQRFITERSRPDSRAVWLRICELIPNNP